MTLIGQLSKLFIPLLFVSCATTSTVVSQHHHPVAKKKVKKVIRARVTYWSNGTCPYGAKVADPKVKRAKEGETVAAPKYFQFGTPIVIPGLKGVANNEDGILKVQDRGRDVDRLKASHGTAPVIDVYVFADNRHAAAKREKYLSSLNPDYMDVEILEPEPTPQPKKL